MGTRGRVSAAALSIIGPGNVEVIPRPQPPDDLTDDQAHEWRAIVNRLPADWFPRETHGMLAAYCRHVVAARKVADLIRAAEGDEETDIGNYDRLLKMQEREGRAISSLATRMRISQQSKYEATKKRAAPSAKRLCDLGTEEAKR